MGCWYELGHSGSLIVEQKRSFAPVSATIDLLLAAALFVIFSYIHDELTLLLTCVNLI